MINSPLSPAEAAQHLLNRRKARTDIVTYASVIDVPGRPVNDDPECELFFPVETNLAAHHKLMLRALDTASKTPFGRVMLLMPPGSAKSTYGDVVFPSKYLADKPGRKLILSSYGSDLARKMGRRTRSIIRQRKTQRITGVSLSDDSAAADQFMLNNGSEYMAAGLLAGITGNRAHGAILDDPISGREAANSEGTRDKTWEAYKDDLLTRLIPGGWFAMILTHWHEDDPAGRILPENWAGESGMIKCRDNMTWNVLCLQARCENQTDPLGRAIGEYLWPEWFTPQHWAQFESSAMTWNSLFQQRPRPPEGAFFTKASFLVDGKPVESPSPATGIFAIIDTAIKTGRQHDGTAVIWCALLPNDFPGQYRMVILDWDYIQVEGGSLERWLPEVFERGEAWSRTCRALVGFRGAWIEDKGSGMVLIQQAHNQGWPVTAIDSKLSSMGKKERAYNAEPYASAGLIKLSRTAFERVVTFKGSTKNHLFTQLFGFAMDSKDDAADDLTDCVTYAVALGIGGAEGF
jgi:hypothetical protein